MNTLLPLARIEETLKSYGFSPGAGFSDRVLSYVELLLKWNRTISLTTVTDPLEIVKFHFGESLFAVSQIENAESRLADVGSGAGFPGLPLAMAFPTFKVTLVESNAKKCAFLAEVIRKIGITNVEVYQARMDSLQREEKFDFATARAFGQFDELLKWARQHISKQGKLLLWLGAEDAAELSKHPRWLWQPPLYLPQASRRVLLVGRRLGE